MPMKLIFLPGGGYFFDSSIRTYWTEQLDPFVKCLLTGKAPGERKVSRLLQIELASDCGFVIYQDVDGECHTRHNLDVKYPKLVQWIKSGAEHYGDRYSIALGPSGRFFALSNRGYRWYAVSEQFHEEIQAMMTGEDDYADSSKIDQKCSGWRRDWKPNGAAFGVSDTFVITCEGGRHLAMSSNLGRHYPDLVKRLKERFKGQRDGASVYSYISINPYKANEWLAVWADESISWNLPPSFASMSGAVREWLSQTKNGKILLASLDKNSPSSSPGQKPSVLLSPLASESNPRPSSAQGKPANSIANSPRPSFTSTHSAPVVAFRPSMSPGSAQSAPTTRPQHMPPGSPLPYNAAPPQNRPPLTGYPPSQTYPPSQSPLWTRPQDTSIFDMLRFFRTMGSHIQNYSGGLDALSGGGGGGNSAFGQPSAIGPMSMLNPSNLSTGYSMSPSSILGGGGDPTGGVLSGGLGGLGGMFPMNPFSLSSSLGLDPTSLALSTGCSIM